MKDISQYIKKIHKDSNIILKKNFFYYCFFLFYNQEYTKKLFDFFKVIFIFICISFSIYISIFLDSIILKTNMVLLNTIISFFLFIFCLLFFGFIFMKISKIAGFIKNKFINFFIERIENYILKNFSGLERNILENIEYLFFFVKRSANDIEDSLDKNYLTLDFNLSNISYDLILKFQKQEKINNF